MPDPFAEFGGQEEKPKDPFVEFGGAEISFQPDDPTTILEEIVAPKAKTGFEAAKAAFERDTPRRVWAEKLRAKKKEPGVIDRLRAAFKSEMAATKTRTPIERFKRQMEIQGVGLRGVAETVPAIATDLASTVAALPTIVMSPDAAKEYQRTVSQSTGLMSDNPFSAAAEERYAQDPVAGYAYGGGRMAGEAGAMMIPGALPAKMARALPIGLMMARGTGQVLTSGAEKKASPANRLRALIGTNAVAAMQGALPFARGTEAMIGRALPGAGRAAMAIPAIGAAGLENVGWQAASNAAMRYVDPERSLWEGAPESFAMGAGLRAGMGRFGTGGVDVDPYQEPYTLKPGEAGRYDTEGRIFQENPQNLKRGFDSSSDVDYAFYQLKQGNLADLNAMKNALKAEWSRIPEPARAEAGRYYDIMNALQDDPSNPNLRRELEAIAPSQDLEKALSVLDMAGREHRGATQEVQAFRGQSGLDVPRFEDRPYFLPRRVNLKEGEAPQPSKGTGQLQTIPDTLKPRTFKALITPDGERIIVNADDFKAGDLPKGAKLGEATIAEIEGATSGKYQYGKDALAETLRSTANARASARAGAVLQGVKDQFSAPKWEGGEVPQGYRQLGVEHPLHDYFEGKPIRSDIAKVLEVQVKPWKESGGSLVDYIEGVNHVVTNIGFINPLVHSPNQFSHFTKGVGLLKLLDPRVSVVDDYIKSLHSIGNMSPEFQEYLLNGGQMMRRDSSTVKAKEELNKYLQSPKVAESLERDLRKYEGTPFGKLFGTVDKFVKEVTSAPTWLADDAMRLSLYKAERQKGVDPLQAVKNVDRSFPDYRVPSNLTENDADAGKGKSFLNKAGEAVFATERMGEAARAIKPLFMTYRQNAWRSFINAWGDTVNGAARSFKGDFSKLKPAMDKIGAALLIEFFFNPQLSKLWDAGLGDEENKVKYKLRPGGHQHIAHQLVDVGKGNISPTQFMLQTAIPNPAVNAGFVAAGFDPYFGQKIPEGGRTAALASKIPWLREGVEMAEHGKSWKGAFATALLGKRDRSDLEQYVTNRLGMRKGQMTEDARENMSDRIALTQAYTKADQAQSAGEQPDLEAVEAAESKMTPDQIKQAARYYVKTPEQRLAGQIKMLSVHELAEAYRKTDNPEEQRMVIRAMASKKPSSKADMLKRAAFLKSHPYTKADMPEEDE